MQKIIVDTGPLVALFDKSDQRHLPIVNFIKKLKGILFTTWPVMTEASHLLDFSVQAPLDLLEWAVRSGISIAPLDDGALKPLHTLMNQYQDRPMDLADASLLYLAVQYNIQSILTFDSDFLFYRLPNRKTLKNLWADESRLT